MNQEQLGYIVYGYIQCNNGVQGLAILVQSQKHPAEVESRIQAFLHHMDVSFMIIKFLVFLILRSCKF